MSSGGSSSPSGNSNYQGGVEELLETGARYQAKDHTSPPVEPQVKLETSSNDLEVPPVVDSSSSVPTRSLKRPREDGASEAVTSSMNLDVNEDELDDLKPGGLAAFVAMQKRLRYQEVSLTPDYPYPI